MPDCSFCKKQIQQIGPASELTDTAEYFLYGNTVTIIFMASYLVTKFLWQNFNYFKGIVLF